MLPLYETKPIFYSLPYYITQYFEKSQNVY